MWNRRSSSARTGASTAAKVITSNELAVADVMVRA